MMTAKAMFGCNMTAEMMTITSSTAACLGKTLLDRVLFAMQTTSTFRASNRI
jgi:hypothetical protein